MYSTIDCSGEPLHPLHTASSQDGPLRTAATDPEMLTFRVSASKSKAPYVCAESITEVWVSEVQATLLGMQLHQAIFSFLFFILSMEKAALGRNFKVP